MYINQTFLNFEVEKIPGIQKLKNIRGQTKPFYQIEFDTDANYDYLILPNSVIVNSKYTADQKSLDTVNAQVNLNTGYEQ